MDEIEKFYREVFQMKDEKLIKDFSEASSLTYIEKGKTLWKVGDCPQQLYLLKEGGLRAVFYSKEGKELTDCFFYMPGDAVMPSFYIDKPSITSAIAFKNSVLVTVPLQKMIQAISQSFEGRDKYEQLLLMHSDRHCIFKSRLQCCTAEERYKWFLEAYPELVGGVSDRCIATFLNMNAVTLSRVRKKMAAEEAASRHSNDACVCEPQEPKA